MERFYLDVKVEVWIRHTMEFKDKEEAIESFNREDLGFFDNSKGSEYLYETEEIKEIELSDTDYNLIDKRNYE